MRIENPPCTTLPLISNCRPTNTRRRGGGPFCNDCAEDWPCTSTRLQALEKLDRVCDFRRRVLALLALDGDVAAVALLLENAEQLREFGQASSELNLDASALSKIPRAVGRVDVEDMRGERLRCLAWGMTVNDQIRRVQVDSQ